MTTKGHSFRIRMRFGALSDLYLQILDDPVGPTQMKWTSDKAEAYTLPFRLAGRNVFHDLVGMNHPTIWDLVYNTVRRLHEQGHNDAELTLIDTDSEGQDTVILSVSLADVYDHRRPKPSVQEPMALIGDDDEGVPDDYLFPIWNAAFFNEDHVEDPIWHAWVGQDVREHWTKFHPGQRAILARNFQKVAERVAQQYTRKEIPEVPFDESDWREDL